MGTSADRGQRPGDGSGGGQGGEGPPQDTPEAGEPEAEAVAVPHQAAAGYPGAVIEHPSGECAWCDALRWRERIRIDGDWR